MVVRTGSSGESEHRRQPNPHSRFFSDQPNTPPFDFRRQVQKRERETYGPRRADVHSPVTPPVILFSGHDNDDDAKMIMMFRRGLDRKSDHVGLDRFAFHGSSRSDGASPLLTSAGSVWW
ncbi:hypothetical protein HanRHA438_Chr09g0409861 [Helianthus annuus]|nr:hypothetical protein HanIR_Chr00c17g0909411 [Helianthus annuus]KAJ0889160.1 hypothetical protein HanRHA438_Chr09g0409861 [Helianthus annuus]